MRFHSGSQRAGPLGLDEPGLFDGYPGLADRYPLSPPLDLRAGDATAHAQYVIHGAPRNTTSEPRWAYISIYVPADVRYIGTPHFTLRGIDIEPRATLDHPLFPLVCP